jgi:hypothetical protein
MMMIPFLKVGMLITAMIGIALRIAAERLVEPQRGDGTAGLTERHLGGDEGF